MIDRRAILAGGAALLCGAARPVDPWPFAQIRSSLGPGARLGVAALDTVSGRTKRLDADSRYAMCSTFKLPLAAFLLHQVERGRATLDEEIAFSAADLVPYAPVIEANLARGRLSVAQLCAAIVEVSDNVAANLLLRRIGGPRGLTAFIRRQGDRVTRLDRFEPELNTNIAGDPRDTTTPAAMLRLTRRLLLGPALRPASRARLIGWLERASTGRNRLRAGVPAGWRVGDKTGNGAEGAANDVAILWPPRRGPILVASFMSAPAVDLQTRDAAHEAVARAMVAAFA